MKVFDYDIAVPHIDDMPNMPEDLVLVYNDYGVYDIVTLEKYNEQNSNSSEVKTLEDRVAQLEKELEKKNAIVVKLENKVTTLQSKKNK